MYIRDVLAVMGEHPLGDFPWGGQVVVLVNGLLPNGFTPIDLTTTHTTLQELMLSLPASIWSAVQSARVPDGSQPQPPLSTPTGPPQVLPVQPSPPIQVGSPAASGDATVPSGDTATDPSASGDDEPPSEPLEVNPERFKSVILIFAFVVTCWSMSMAWGMRHYNPNAVSSKSLIVKLFQQAADTIDSAATGNPPNITPTPTPPMPVPLPSGP
jgi:hypothetical protein